MVNENSSLPGALSSIHTPEVNKNRPLARGGGEEKAEETPRHGRLQASWVPDRVALRRPRLGPVPRRRCCVVTRVSLHLTSLPPVP